jgi:squalene-hopene/tetraprenyl-beta-curcumene cyclase
MSKTKELLEEQFSALSSILKREQNEEGFWEGRLSSSALSTAIAIVALQIDGKRKDDPGIQSGFVWLSENINPDGGYGDTSSSASNVSTSLICYAAISYCALPGREKELLKSIEQYLLTKNISLTTKQITSTILAFYGKDYTFSVPILALLIICKVLPPEAIQHIPQLPFELSLLPPSLYRFSTCRWSVTPFRH